MVSLEMCVTADLNSTHTVWSRLLGSARLLQPVGVDLHGFLQLPHLLLQVVVLLSQILPASKQSKQCDKS